MTRYFATSFLSVVLLGLSAVVTAQGTSGVVNFEGPQSRPIAVSTAGDRLFALNTPDHRVEVYSLANPAVPVLIDEIPVGLEPVSLAIRSKDELWVVNHVSDSVSVVSLRKGAVVATIRVGDEPGDIAFAGNPQRAFVSSMTRREVLVINPTTHAQVGTIPVFGDDPRSLLASPDGKTLWVAVTRSGNKSTVVPHTIAPTPPKPTNTSLPNAPAQGILVSSDDTTWKSKLNVTLPDNDVVEIDTATMKVRRNYRGVGTILFNLTLRPGTSELFVTNTEARNLVRFEPTLKGHAIDSRVTRIATGANPTITPVDLNPSINYGQFPNTSALGTALSQPADIVFERTGKLAYVASFGTDRIGVIDAAGKVLGRIEVGNTPGAKLAPRTKRGPRGLAHHPSKDVLYVLNRLSNSLSIVDTVNSVVTLEIPMFDPTPKALKEGRGYLFDAKLSGNGTMSCASCHIDGRHDGIAWDLGNPGGQLFSNGTSTKLHPMKGPLLTQTLQGLSGERLFHWRADKPGLATFNGAFKDLMGGQLLNTADMNSLVGYMLAISFMPNPNRNLDDTLKTTPVGTSQKDGETLFLTKNNVGKEGTTQFRCIGCHTNASGSGSFGFTGLIQQQTKVAQLRGLYKRNGRKPQTAGRTAGFGFGADGSKDDLPTYLSTTSRFNALTKNEKTALERFLLSFPTGVAPAVGMSRTVSSTKISQAAWNDLVLLITQAEKNNCDLVAKGILGRRQVGLLYDTTSKQFVQDRASLGSLTFQQLATAMGQSGSVLTFVGVPPGSGRQIGIDRDANGTLDGDEGQAHYGGTSPPCTNVLAIDTNSPPRVGNPRFAIVLSGAQANAAGWILLSANRANAKVSDLSILVDLNAGIILPVQADNHGVSWLQAAVPSNAALAGAMVRVQGVMSAPCGLLNLTASRGLELTLLK